MSWRAEMPKTFFRNWKGDLYARDDPSDQWVLTADTQSVVTRANAELDAKDARIAELEAEELRRRAYLDPPREHSSLVDAAHEVCECAMSGGSVSQPSLTLNDTASAQGFAAAFNELAGGQPFPACAILAVPVKGGAPGVVSLQLCGQVDLCKLVEKQLRGQTSVYQGDHAEVTRG